MTAPEILQQLEHCRAPFPRAEVAEAIARREEITPELLRILERVADNPAAYTGDGNYFAHIFALFLLAKFRESRAYPLALRIAAMPGETLFDLIGDVATENLGAILASVCGGDDAGLKALIENPGADEYVRPAGMAALLTLVATGQRSREEVMDYFAGLFHRLERKPNYIWSALANACSDLCPIEVQDEIRQAYDDHLIEVSVIHPDDVRDALALGKEEAVRRLRNEYQLIDDLETEMQWMSGFHTDSDLVEAQPFPFDDDEDYEVMEPYQRPGPKVGRNDPCPCGSGKKFKKCCGK